MNEPMIRVQRGAYAVWRLLGLTPALALLDGRAAAAAQDRGFTTVNMLAGFKAQGFRDRRVNRWDQHPSAECNRIYASHIADVIAPLVAGQQGDDQTAMGDTG